MNGNKKIYGINKRTKYMNRFLGKVSLLLDNRRLENVKRTQNPNEGINIKSDEIKIKAITFLEDDCDKEFLLETIKDDDKKIEAINFLEGVSQKARAIGTLNNDNKKIQLLNINDFDSESKCGIVCSLKEDDRKEKLLNELDFDIKSKCNIVCSLKEDNRKEKLLNKLGFDAYLKAEIIGSFSSGDKILEILEKNDFNEMQKLEIFEELKDEQKIEIVKSTEIDVIRKAEIIESINDKKLKNKLYKSLGINKKYLLEKNFLDRVDNVIEQKYKSFDLPKEMTIGMEIEAEGMYRNLFLENFNIKGWENKNDGSLGIKGTEVISPIMSEGQKHVEEIYEITSLMKKFGFLATEVCGGHVHIGADYLKSVEEFQELLEIYGNTEEIFYLISNKPKELPRKDIDQQAAPISKKIEESNLGQQETDEFIEDAKEVQDDRHSGINLMNVNNGKNTIEFRLSNGTIDPNTWIENIRLYGRTVQMAHEISQINMKLQQGEQITQEEIKKLQMKSILKKEVSRDEKIDALMELLFDKKEQKVYYERYKANKELYDKEENKRKMKFGIVDFKRLYDNVEIPKDIISKLSDISKSEIIEEISDGNIKNEDRKER